MRATAASRVGMKAMMGLFASMWRLLSGEFSRWLLVLSGLLPPSPLVLRKFFKTLGLGPDLIRKLFIAKGLFYSSP